MYIRINIADLSGIGTLLKSDQIFSPVRMLLPEAEFRQVKVTGRKSKIIDDIWVWFELYNHDPESKSISPEDRLEGIKWILNRKKIRANVFNTIPNETSPKSKSKSDPNI